MTAGRRKPIKQRKPIKKTMPRKTRAQRDLEFLTKEFNVSAQQIAGARRATGNSRAKLEAYLRSRAQH